MEINISFTHITGGSNSATKVPSASSNIDLLGDLNINAPAPPISAMPSSSLSSITSAGGNNMNLIADLESNDPWGDFTSAPITNSQASKGKWEKF